MVDTVPPGYEEESTLDQDQQGIHPGPLDFNPPASLSDSSGTESTNSSRHTHTSSESSDASFTTPTNHEPEPEEVLLVSASGAIVTLFFETHKLIDSEDLVNDEKYVQEIEKFTQAVAPYVQNEDLSTIIVPIFKGARRTAHETLEDFNPLCDLLLRSMALPPSFLDSSQFPNQPSGNMKGGYAAIEVGIGLMNNTLSNVNSNVVDVKTLVEGQGGYAKELALLRLSVSEEVGLLRNDVARLSEEVKKYNAKYLGQADNYRRTQGELALCKAESSRFEDEMRAEMREELGRNGRTTP